MQKVPGEEGFSLVTYTGKAKTPKEWIGPITGTTYMLGGDRHIALVDKRDSILFTDKLFDTIDAATMIVDDTVDDPLVSVSLLAIRGASVLIRRSDMLACCYVPRFSIDTGAFTLKRVKNPRVALSILDIAIPHGENWTSIFHPIEFDPVRFNHNLKMAGVWTTDDFRARPKTIHRIIYQMLGLSDAVAKADAGTPAVKAAEAVASKSQGG